LLDIALRRHATISSGRSLSHLGTPLGYVAGDGPRIEGSVEDGADFSRHRSIVASLAAASPDLLHPIPRLRVLRSDDLPALSRNCASFQRASEPAAVDALALFYNRGWTPIGRRGDNDPSLADPPGLVDLLDQASEYS